jgi:hypothetical protein
MEDPLVMNCEQQDAKVRLEGKSARLIQVISNIIKCIEGPRAESIRTERVGGEGAGRRQDGQSSESRARQVLNPTHTSQIRTRAPGNKNTRERPSSQTEANAYPTPQTAQKHKQLPQTRQQFHTKPRTYMSTQADTNTHAHKVQILIRVLIHSTITTTTIPP